jgi:serine/threonine protein phosphatase PrpC
MSAGSELVKPSFFLLDGLPDSALLLLTGEAATADRLPADISGFPVNLIAGDPPVESGREPSAADESGQWCSGALSNVGKVRKLNEDAFLERSDSGLWAVADGMGGHHAGDVASRTTIVALNEIAASRSGVHKDLDVFVGEVVDCLEKTNRQLVGMARQLSPEAVIGSTVVVMLAAEDQCAVVWSGDSRLYQYRDGILTQLTRDHSLVNEMISSGRGSREELAESRISNVVTQALGAEAELKAETIRFTALKNDLYLLCSDGLTGEVNDVEICRLLAQNEFDDIPRVLIDTALQRRAGDNVTVVIVRWV